MRKIAIGTVLVAVIILAPVLSPGSKTRSRYRTEKLAIDICMAAVETGAYVNVQAAELVQYCVAVAVGLKSADYSDKVDFTER